MLNNLEPHIFKSGSLKSFLNNNFNFTSPLEILKLTIELATYNAGGNPEKVIYGGPFGAIVYDSKAKKIIGCGTNSVHSDCDPSAHAEVKAIRDALKTIPLINDMELYTSCECCPMCLSFALSHGITSIYFSATREDAASVGFSDAKQYDLIHLPLHHQISKADQSDIEKLENNLLVIIKDNHIFRFNESNQETLIVEALRQICKIEKSFHLPFGYKFISKYIPHPYSLIALDWARIGRIRSKDYPNDPAYDSNEKDVNKIVYVQNQFEQFHSESAMDTLSIIEVLKDKNNPYVKFIEIADSYVPFKIWSEIITRVKY